MIMEKQTSLFDLEYGELLKRQGMEMAVLNRLDILELAQKAAIELGRIEREVTIDLVHEWMILRYEDYTPSKLGNASGAVFKGGQWVFTGCWAKSRRYSSHGRMVRIWRLKNDRNRD